MFDERSLPGFQLSLVSRRWRRVSLSFPTLYNQVCMNVENVNGTLCHDALAVQEYLRRSKNLPLTICLLHQDYLSDEDDALFPQPFNSPMQVAFTKESERWEDVRLKLHPNAYEGAAFRAVKGRLRTFRRLHLYNPYKIPNKTIQVPECFYECPALEDIALDWKIMPSRVPPNAWPNIKTAFLTALTWPCVVNFLPQISTKLSSLTISDPCYGALGVSADITLPALETLCIQAIDESSHSSLAPSTSSGEVAIFLENFRFPKLEEL